LVRTDKYFNFFYGDKISISGKLEVPQNFENENGKTFDYKNYLLKDDVLFTSFYPEIEILEKGSRKNIKYYIFKFKHFLTSKAQMIFKSETSSLVLGVIFGIKDSIDPTLEDNFRRTGLIHILVLSGFNLTIIAYFIFKLLSFTHRNIRYSLSLIFILIFVIMVGAGATIVRAGIMISLFILSKFVRRNSNSLNALILAGSFMIFLNPMILLYDPSFQLSFVATLGLISFYPLLELTIFKAIKWKVLKEIVISNISVQITVIPLLIFLMGEFSIISILPNILVLPLIPFFMAISFLAILISFFIPFLSIIPTFLTEVLSSLIVWTVNFFGNLEFAVMKVPTLRADTLLIIFSFYIILIFGLNLRNSIIEKQKYSYLQSSSNSD
jgi:competence protein ComEC